MGADRRRLVGVEAVMAARRNYDLSGVRPGMKLRELAALWGVSTSHAGRVAERLSIAVRPYARTDRPLTKRVVAIGTALDAGMRVKDIAVQFGVSKQAVSQAAKLYRERCHHGAS